ncbi:DUF4167 domain-containing protein [Sphingosinicella sp. LHD-64]|uniref:DUF4167 domain-containing protein n=1 Tax=Sphingosinicella sp. LHD-64 TaxID=3072139 RepID=UPI00280FC605|nr:DUF4167 domain-containing protein [Sphingosinicella sp. LHD-64]MDQ8756697.1 DUF4167 domain-containing protein [Sphingosinicella sp. LHD-64]
MINNRQGGRRRGRGGGGRPPGSNPNPGNRQDNRQRGNAAQLLEKYKGLARDAQMQGDRVQTEYFLQFADHYFRVLNENRARFEEQRRQRDDYGDEDEGEEELNAADTSEAAEDSDEGDEPRREAPPRREERGPRNGEYRARRGRGRREEGEAAGQEHGDANDGGGERIALDVLPPAISATNGASHDENEAAEEAPRPARTRRPRRPRGEDEIAPAA